MLLKIRALASLYCKEVGWSFNSFKEPLAPWDLAQLAIQDLTPPLLLANSLSFSDIFSQTLGTEKKIVLNKNFLTA